MTSRFRAMADGICLPQQAIRQARPPLLALAVSLIVSSVATTWSDDASIKRPAADQARIDRLIRAAAGGEVDELKKMLADKIDLNARNKSGLTALAAARIFGQTEAIALLASKGADAKAPTPAPEKLVDGLLSQRIKDPSPAVAILVSQDGKVLYSKAFGLANLEHKIAATTDTKFRIGSISKQFTAAAILKLVEQGKLQLTDKLSKFVPDFPKGDKVTIHHLLTHTSGIHSYTGRPDFMQTARVYVAPEDLIKIIKSDPYDFEPGQRWLYNNSGYFLLGYIVEKVSGKPYGDFLKQTFFEPLGMKDTGVHKWSDILDNEAAGYSFEGGKLHKAENWDMSRAGGAGALYSTVGDLHRWNEGVFNGKVLAEPSLKAAWTAVVTDENRKDPPKEAGYGYGWGIAKTRGLREISHGGGLHGFNSYLLRMPAQRFSVAVLVNALPAPAGLDAAAIAHEIANYYLWDKMAARPTFVAKRDVSAKTLETYVGRYDYGAAVLTVSRKDNRLFAQLTGQPNHEIFPKSETEFFWKVVDAQVKFVKNDRGEVVKAVHSQGGQTINAPKMVDVPEIKVDAKILDAYVGKYSLLGSQLTISKDGERLFAQVTGQPKFELFAKSETEFFLKVVNAQFTFVKGANGKFEKVKILQGGMNFEAVHKQE